MVEHLTAPLLLHGRVFALRPQHCSAKSIEALEARGGRNSHYICGKWG